MVVNPDDVRDTYGNIANDAGDAASDTYIQTFISKARRLEEDVFSGRVRTLGEVEGDTDDFVELLACHLLQITEGGDPDSESSTGGSVTYSHLQGDIESTLTETRFGRLARLYLRNEVSIGIEKT